MGIGDCGEIVYTAMKVHTVLVIGSQRTSISEVYCKQEISLALFAHLR